MVLSLLLAILLLLIAITMPVITAVRAQHNGGPLGGGGGTTPEPRGGNYGNIRYTTDFNWTPQVISAPLTAGKKATVALSPCPKGMDNSGSYQLGVGSATYGALSGYTIHIFDATNNEDPFVMGGTGTPGSASCTAVFTPYFSYPSGFTIQSSSSGIQEAINDGCGATPTPFYLNGGCDIIIPADLSRTAPFTHYTVTGRIFFHANWARLQGYGAIVDCTSRGPCLQLGRQMDSSYMSDVVAGMAFHVPRDMSSDPAYHGTRITSTRRIGGHAVITTATPHGFRTGDPVTILWTDNAGYWGDVPYITVIDATSFSFERPGSVDLPLQQTPGTVALSFEAILDNAQATQMVDIKGMNVRMYGVFNNFIDFWDDEAARIEHFNNGTENLNQNVNWTGAYLFSGGASNLPDRTHQLAPVISVNGSNITANSNSCMTVLNSNGVFVRDMVCQASSPWQFNIQISTGNYGGFNGENIYAESATSLNPAATPRSPWPGLGIAGVLTRLNVGSVTYKGAFTPFGQVQTAGTGKTPIYYWLVVHDTTNGQVTAPVLIYKWNSTGRDQPVIPWARWANGADTVTYDLIRYTGNPSLKPNSVGATEMPYTGGCIGGSTTACGSVVVAMPQCAGFVCSFTDNLTAPTASYNVPSVGTWIGQIEFFPAVYGTTGSTANMDHEPGFPSVGVGMFGNPTVNVPSCGYGIPQSGGGYSSCLQGQIANNNANPAQVATLMLDGAGNGGSMPHIVKGRLNFSRPTNTAGIYPRHIITLCDSNPSLTKATTSYRPEADPTDCYIGMDHSPTWVQQGISFGAPMYLSRYIGNIGDDVNWKERLSATQETYKVPVNIAPVRYASLPACNAAAEGTFATVNDSTVNTYGAQIAGGGTYHVPAYCNGTHWMVH